MQKEPDQVQTQFHPKYEFDQLKDLKNAAENHIHSSELYLPVLRVLSNIYLYTKNHIPSETLAKGSYYLRNAYHLVQVYKVYVPGSIDNRSIQSVNDMLVALEFNPKHISSGYTDEAYGDKAECFVSNGQGTKYYKLLHSELRKDVRSFIEMVELNIDIPVKRFLESIKQRLQSALPEKLLEAIENQNPSVVKECIQEGAIVNFKDNNGRTPLHYAVNSSNIDVVSTLLKHGAEVAQTTKKGNTPLHTASLKGCREIVEVLLQYVRHDELDDFVNAKTTSGCTTSLHVAAKNGFSEVVKSLLKHGATYNIENKEGKTPINLSKDEKVANILKFVEELFEGTEKGNIEIINKLKVIKQDEFLTVTGARNNQGNTLLQVATANGHTNIASHLLRMLKEPDQVQLQFHPKCEFDQLKDLKSAAENHIRFSNLYLPMLRDMSYPYDSEKNPSPWKTCKEGSYYLGNVYGLVELYKVCVPGSIDNRSMQLVNDMLVALEFNPKHISSGYTDDAYGGKAECFVSSGQDTKYYKLLHSELKKDVRSFIEMVELNIELPVKRFLESIKQRLQSALLKKLLEAIENHNPLAVERGIQEGAIVNFTDTSGRTPIHHAVNNGDVDVVNMLLKHGAEVAQTTNDGSTLLHLASSKGCREVVEVLLQYVRRDELDDFINAKTTSGCTTSLHVAAKNGFSDVVTSLLKHSATYNFENKEGKTPINLSKDEKVTNILKFVEELFEDTKKGNIEIINKLKVVKQDEFLAVTTARNNQGKTLLQVAIANGYRNIASHLLRMLKEPDQRRLQFHPECEFDQLKDLKNAAENHIHSSELYLPVLRLLSNLYLYTKNHIPSETLEKGSYYLRNAYHLVQVYKVYVPGSIDNRSIQSVNDMLVALEFNPKHISSGYTDEAYGDKAECFVSNGQGTKYYKLLHSELRKDVRSFIEMVELNIDIPVKSFLESIKQRLQSALPEKLLEAIENHNPLVVEECIQEGATVNFKDTTGRTPLHHAVNSGNIDVVNALLKHGAEVAQTTNDGSTLLHLASSKGCREVVEVLLQYVQPDRLNDFINAKTTFGCTTSLHVAAKNGFSEVVKSLLKHGATYNIENKEGKTPINLSKDEKVTNILKFVEELFEETEKGNIEIINKLKVIKQDEFLTVKSARNNQGNTLLQVATANGHTNIVSHLLRMLKEPDQVQLQFHPKCEFDQLKELKSAAENHIRFSNLYLPVLRDMSFPYSEKNPSPWKTCKEGSYYLGNVYDLVELYKVCVPGSIDNRSMQLVNDMLVALEFNPKHISSGYTDEAYGGEAECFVSKGQGTKYYKLLHSELKKDVRSFIEMVELNIELPVKSFLESIKQRLQSALPEKLLEAIENHNPLVVEKCIQEGATVNFKDTSGRTPLHHAVNSGNVDVVNALLKHGAEVAQTTNDGSTLLHLASSKGCREVVEVLLQYVRRDGLNDFINAKTTFGCTTSRHVAAKNGFLDVVKSLLKHGATYNVENKDGKTPINLSKDEKVTNILKFIEKLFEDTKKGNIEIINKLKVIKQDEFLAVMSTRNNQGDTILQVALANGHRNVVSNLLKC